jgi:succinate dehydrogenase/fumarate reductase flavoprotein subunit
VPPAATPVSADGSETVSTKYVIVGGGVAALHAVAAIRER